MKIRKAKKEDIKEIVKVELGSGYHKKKFNVMVMVEELFENKNEYICVAEENDKVIGYRSFNLKGKVADSGYLAIIKKYQGKGIGTKLLKKSISKSKKLGCSKMIINVRNDNFVAINLYNKLGFSIVEVIRKGQLLKLKMEKKLR